MNTITVSKTKYEILERQALLYKKLLKGLEEKFFTIEEYSPKRLKEFFKEDKISPKIKSQLGKILK